MLTELLCANVLLQMDLFCMPGTKWLPILQWLEEIAARKVNSVNIDKKENT